MTWHLAFVLPNIAMQEPFDSEWLAIVPRTDPRLLEFCYATPNANFLLDRFTDIRNRRVSVSALIVRDDVPDTIRRRAAPLYAYRNMLAISCLTRGVEERLRHSHNDTVAFSTSFDFYPVQLSRDGEGLITDSVALSGWDEPASFHGQPDPTVPSAMHFQVVQDRMLTPVLKTAWMRHFTQAGSRRAMVALFRSLEVAYQAASLPKSATLHEFGARIALWVSAIEILAHAASGRANLGTVLDLLDPFPWHDSRLGHRRNVVMYRHRRRVPFIGKLYRELYAARNDFFHGNPVTVRRLYPFRRLDLPLLNRVVPLIYKVALLTFLEPHRDRRRTRDAEQGQLTAMWEQGQFEESLLLARG
jgi:hypothetical protein